MRKIFTVGQINRYIRGLFAQDTLLTGVFVRGEISNCKYHTSGHIYFSIKDETGSLACVMFAGNRRGLAFPMKDGDKVVVSGTVDVYERDGRYQLYAREIHLEGEGELFERFQRLKRKLEAEGLFRVEIKKPIPGYAGSVGIVTAPTGAAIRDIQNIAGRRNPYVQLILCPALVQGDGAAESIVRGINMLDGLVDVIIVGRGGGSLEDLWAFNEEIVARAIYNCSTPVISAVGHETDVTISDFAADLRAPTPSAAAELAVYDRAKLLELRSSYERAVREAMRRKISDLRMNEKIIRARLETSGPSHKLRERQMRASQLEARFANTLPRRLEEARRRYEGYPDRMKPAMTEKLKESARRASDIRRELKSGWEGVYGSRVNTFSIYLARLDGLNPLSRLRQGFSFVTDGNGKAVRSAETLKPGDQITVQVIDGKIEASVTDVEEYKLHCAD
ncbi:MAG: exodeoxyribonuclease VII large subunit [Lachnospiraceae bacterium]|nr:exodeoxyribonuclease VII large subunit [Lachnospiraceae bacterium]